MYAACWEADCLQHGNMDPPYPLHAQLPHPETPASWACSEEHVLYLSGLRALWGTR